jgi:hypothetical protein
MTEGGRDDLLEPVGPADRRSAFVVASAAAVSSCMLGSTWEWMYILWGVLVWSSISWTILGCSRFRPANKSEAQIKAQAPAAGRSQSQEMPAYLKDNVDRAKALREPRATVMSERFY